MNCLTLIYEIFHLNLSKPAWMKILTILEYIKLFQMIELIRIHQNIDYKQNGITYVIRIITVFNDLEEYQKQILIFFMFLIHGYLIVLFIYFCLRQLKLIKKITQYSLLIYCSLFYVPIIQINLEIFSINCDNNFCRVFGHIILQILAAINIVICLIINLIQGYFGRSENESSACLMLFSRNLHMLILRNSNHIIDYRFTTSYWIRLLFYLILIMQFDFQKKLRKSYLIFVSHQLKNLDSFYKYLIKANHDDKCENIHKISQCLLKRLIIQKKDLWFNLLYSKYQTNQKPIKALILIQEECQDFYFKLAYKSQINKILRIIVKQQKIDKQDYLDVNQVRKSYEFVNQTRDSFIYHLQSQINLWQGFIQGLSCYDEYIKQIKYLSLKMIAFKKYTQKNTQFKQLNVMQLRVLSIYNTVIYLKSKLVIKYEQQIADKIKINMFRIDSNINNQILNQGQFLLIQSSLLNIGTMVQFNKLQYLRYFNLPTNYMLFIKSIDCLMPKFIKDVHEKFIDNYKTKGVSHDQNGINTYMIKPTGFIQNVNIQINLNHSVTNDIIITAVISQIQQINKIIIISDIGQILGMDEFTFKIIQDQSQIQSMNIQYFISQGIWIQTLIRNISTNIKQLIHSKIHNQTTCLYNFNDKWNGKQRFNKSKKTCNSMCEQVEDKFKILDQMFEEDNINQDGQSIIYNLEYVSHTYKGGELTYIKVFILDDENVQGVTQKYQQSCNQDQDNEVDKETMKIQNLNKMPSCKFILPASPSNSTEKLIQIDFTDRKLEQDTNPVLQIDIQKKDVKLFVKKNNNEKRIDQQPESSLHSTDSSQFKQQEIITERIQDQKWLVKPIQQILILSFLIQLLTLIIIIVNVILIKTNITYQLQQIDLIRQPQDITYVYSSLILQYYFQLLNFQNVIPQSPYMLNDNQLKIEYMNNQIFTKLYPLSISAPLIAQRFNVSTFPKKQIIRNKLTQTPILLSQMYQEHIQNLLYLYEQNKAQTFKWLVCMLMELLDKILQDQLNFIHHLQILCDNISQMFRYQYQIIMYQS